MTLVTYQKCMAKKVNANNARSPHVCKRVKGHLGKHQCKRALCADAGGSGPMRWTK